MSNSHIMLKATITVVHAKSSGVIKYSFDLYSSFPIVFLASPMTSAATPDFQAIPTATELADKKYGRVLGTYMENMRLKIGILKTFAMSISFVLVSLMPVSVFVYIPGSTIMAGMNMAKSSESIHKSESITKDATGTDFITFTGSHISDSKNILRDANMAKISPKIIPIVKPRAIFLRVDIIDNLNVAEGSRSFNSTEKTLPGVGKKTSLSMVMARMCHMTIQKMMDMPYRLSFIKFLCLLVLIFKIEHFLL